MESEEIIEEQNTPVQSDFVVNEDGSINMESEEIVEEQNTPVKSDFVVNEDGSITVDDITIPPPPQPALTVEATKERLIISELVVRDFKSYAGTHVIGPFNKNFSCIVGPNGSGKSNVIDSLLFVFGYRAQKIRSKKVSVLIHKSHKYPDLQSCSVQVNFIIIKDEGRDFKVVPNSKFSVKRTGYIDNSSTYEINGRRSTYKDVAAMLRGYGIDLDYNRFMILQGEIELISMMKPKAPSEQESGMLEYIEDVIGTNRFIKPIQHFDEKVEKINEFRLEKINQLKIIEKERADFEKPRKKALEYIELANNVTLLKNSALQAQIQSIMEEKELINENKKTLDEKMEVLSVNMDNIKAGKEEKQSELKVLIHDYEKRAKTVDDLKKEFSELERQDVACRENIKNLKDKMKKLSKSLETEEAKIPSLKKKQVTLEQELQELDMKKKKIEELKSIEEEKLNEVMESVKEEIQCFQEEQDKFESDLVKLKSAVNEKKSEMNLVENELQLVLSAEEKEKEVLESLHSEFEKNKLAISEEEKSLKQGEEKLPQLQKDLESSRQKFAETEKKEAIISEEIKIKRIKLGEVQSSVSATQSRNVLVKAFTEQKAKGKFHGVLGRLGDLGAIDAKYDIAISTACRSLDNIVTDTITTAQECIDFLKKNNLGYSTFIPLEKMEKWIPYTQQKIATPENVPRLFDLIKVKNKDVLPAFYYALRDTLVAKDLDQATRVGLQGNTRYKVVTLKGELIDLSGTMTGGGGRLMKGQMGQSLTEDPSISRKDIEKLTKDIENLSEEATAARSLKQELKENIRCIEQEIPKLQHTLKKAQSNYHAYVENAKMLTLQIEDQKKKIKSAAPDKNKIKELESKIEEKKKKYTKATSEAAVVEEKVKSLQEKILAITKGKIGMVQKKVDKITKEVESISDAMVKSNTLIKKAVKDLKKAEEKVESLQKDREKCNIGKEQLTKEFEELGQKGLEVTAMKEAALKELEVFEPKKKELSRVVQEFSSKLQQMKSELIEFKNKVKIVEANIKTKMSHANTYKKEIEKLSLYQIDNEPTTMPTLSADELSEININAVYIDIGRLEKQMENMNPDLSAIAEYKRIDDMYKLKHQDFLAVVEELEHNKQHYDRLRKYRMDEFMKGFTIVSLKVKELYQMITLGGDAELELVDSLDPFSEGIEFSVRPVRKSWKNIRNLSGGEKTLSSLSLVFALHYFRSTPFFVMDEIDAALDFRNVSIIANYIKESTKNAQFIVISLRENMFQLADHLVGIYKTNNRTKNVHCNQTMLEMFESIEKSLRTPIEKDLNKADGCSSQEDKEDKSTELQSTLRSIQVNSAFDKLLEKPKKGSVTFDLNPTENKGNDL